MRVLMMAAAAAMAGWSAGLVASDGQPAGTPVRLSAVAVDQAGLPVRDLTARDFRVTENGKPAPVSQLDFRTTAETTRRGRAIVLVMGAAGTDPQLTTRAQAMARGFFDRAAPDDQLSVVRFSARDEIAGTREEMLMRIAEFRAGMGEPLNMRTNRDVLDTVARLSRELMDADAPRRAIVFIGSPFVYDVILPSRLDYDIAWPNWVQALSSAASANVGVYVIDPNGLRGNIRINPDGLVAQTGGTIFYNRNDLEKAMDTVWRDGGSYYDLQYHAAASRRDLQDIRVTTTRPGVTVRARRSR